MSDIDQEADRPVEGVDQEPVVQDPPPPPPVYRATFDEEGLPLAFYPSFVWLTGYPASAIEITEEQWQEFIDHQGQRRWDGANVVLYNPPAEPLPPVTISADVLFFDRMTDAEYDSLDAAVKAGESARIYRGWAAATSFTEGTDMWALLVRHLDATVSATRKRELLARA